MIRPLTRATLFFAAGLLIGLRAPLHGILPILAAGAATALVLLVVGRRALIPFAAISASGLLLGHEASVASRAGCRAGLPDGIPVQVRGAFEALAIPGGAAPFLLEEVGLGAIGMACEGTIRARIAGGRRPIPPAGTELRARGRWQAIPREGHWPRPAARAGVLLLDSARVLDGEGHRHPQLATRGAAQARLRALFGERGAMAEALVLAQQDGLDPELRDRFARSGLVHLLSISGQHVWLVAGVLLLLGRVLRASLRVAAVAAATATAAYVLFLGAPYPAARAALQVLLILAARLSQRPSDPLTILAATALLLLALDPLALLDAGFQLSYAGTAGIVLLRRRILGTLPARLGRVVNDSLATSLAATLATAPIAALHFGAIAPIGVIANLPAVPLVAAAVPAIALALAIAPLSEPLARFLAGGAGALLEALDRVAAVAARVPGGSILVPRDQVLGWALAALAAALAAAWLASPERRPRRRSAGGVRPIIRRAAAFGVAAALLLVWPRAVAHLGGDELQIHAIDVGQGDAIAIRTPAGRWILVDAGPRSDRFDAGRARVVPFLLRQGARRLEALVLTHPDADHIGGAASVLAAFDVGAVIDPGLAAGKAMYLDVLRDAQRKGIRWIAARAGREIRVDEVTLRLLFPGESPLDGSAAANDVSVAFRLEYGRFAALFLGDAPAAVEESLAARHGPALRAEVLKVAHHGSATSTSEALLDAAAPRIALISVGRRNRYGHPDPSVLERLARHRLRILRTDRQGTITLRARADGRIAVETAR